MDSSGGNQLFETQSVLAIFVVGRSLSNRFVTVRKVEPLRCLIVLAHFQAHARASAASGRLLACLQQGATKPQATCIRISRQRVEARNVTAASEKQHGGPEQA